MRVAKLSVALFLAFFLSFPGQAETGISSQLFVNASNIQQQHRSSTVEGWELDLKRFYIDVNHRLDADWKVIITTDVQWRRQQAGFYPVITDSLKRL